MPDIATLKRQALELERNERFDDALTCYLQLLDAVRGAGREEDIALYVRIGDLLLKLGRAAEAASYYEQAAEQYAEGGFFNNAIALYNRALRLDPDRETTRYGLGKVYARKGFPDDAARCFLEYADRMRRAGQDEEACRALREFADLVPDQDDVRLLLGEQLARMDRGQEAIDELQALYDTCEVTGRDADAPVATGRTGSDDLVFLDLGMGDDRGAPSGAEQLERVRDERSAPPRDPAAHEVALGASAPRSAGRGDEFTARFVAYLPDDEASVRQILTDLSPRSAAHLDVQRLTWAAGTTVAVRVSGRGLEVQPAVQAFTWNGKRALLEFDVLVSDDARCGATCVLRYDVVIAEVVVARMRLDLEVTAERGVGEERSASASAPRSAFASYASPDRDRVLDRVAALRAVAGVDVFVDHLAMTPGEKWKERIRREILERDRFLLFWSARARDSEWVTWEWRTALAERGIDVILPQPLEPPSVAPAPPELSELHFGDFHLLLLGLHDDGSPGHGAGARG